MFFLIWIGLFMFRHRSARLLMCKRAQFHHAMAMTQIYSQEMSEVFQFSYFDMEDTFSSFGTVAHYFFCYIVGLSDSLKQWIFRDKCANEGLFVSVERGKKTLALRDTRYDSVRLTERWLVSVYSFDIMLLCAIWPSHKGFVIKYIQYTYGKCTQESKRARGCGPLSQVYGSLQLAYKFSHQFHDFEWKTNW